MILDRVLVLWIMAIKKIRSRNVIVGVDKERKYRQYGECYGNH